MANAIAAYAKISGINGDSEEPHHIQWIELLSVDWGGARGGFYGEGAARGSAVGAGRELRFTKLVDVASARLHAAAAAGTHIPQIDVELTKSVRIIAQAGVESDSHLVLLMKNVVVASVRHGATKPEEFPAETIALNYGSVQSMYR